MRKAWFALIIPGALGVFAIVLVISLLLIKLMWAWTVPDLFPAAVKQGLIARDISWLTAFKVAIIIGALSGTAHGSRKCPE